MYSQDFIESNIDLIERLNNQLEDFNNEFIRLNQRFLNLFPSCDFREILKDALQHCSSYDYLLKFYSGWCIKCFVRRFNIFDINVSNNQNYRVSLNDQINDLLSQYSFDELLDFIKANKLDISTLNSKVMLQKIFEREFSRSWIQTNIALQKLICLTSRKFREM